MAMTREQYTEAGRKAWAAGNPRAALKPGTWQQVAYDEGFDAVAPKKHAGGRPPGKSRAKLLAFNTDEWPRAAKEHVTRLADDYSNEKDPARAARLMLAIQRMVKRHGRPVVQPVRANPSWWFDELSTQPHPDGPITIGQVLQGK